MIQRSVQQILFRTRSRRTKNNFCKLNCGIRFETRLSKFIRRSVCARQLFCLRFNNVYLLNSRRQLLLTSELCSLLNEHAILSAGIPLILDGRPDSSVLARGPMPSAASTQRIRRQSTLAWRTVNRAANEAPPPPVVLDTLRSDTLRRRAASLAQASHQPEGVLPGQSSLQSWPAAACRARG